MLAAGAVLTMSVTAYGLGCDAPNEHTSSGVRPTAHHTVAADPAIPFGTVLHVEGVGRRVVQDRGALVVGDQLDLFMDDCDAARQWGRRTVRVYVLSVPNRTATQSASWGAAVGTGRSESESGKSASTSGPLVARSATRPLPADLTKLVPHGQSTKGEEPAADCVAVRSLPSFIAGLVLVGAGVIAVGTLVFFDPELR